MERIMKRILVIAAALAVSTGAWAQLYKWKGQDGRMQYGDTPPPGVAATPMGGRSAAAPASEAPKAGDPGDKALSPDAAFRKRQAERQAAEEKAAKEREQAQAKKENCERAQGQLRTLESGMRMTTTNAAGERVFIDDEQRAQEMQRAQKAVSGWCN